jgi:uncharacterized protein (DUF3084 family)
MHLLEDNLLEAKNERDTLNAEKATITQAQRAAAEEAAAARARTAKAQDELAKE